ncbi:sugar-binding transcriptional regulator [Pelagovum pacificum]|uniref:Sugar-binding transcriptional regulator n=1 Tax=Pelagovum pacificum TaxID=2588711 RepID=A0A5C5GAE3_9RHOB|nr:sugar-binding transcriptional regulator [Pelagovum pacificum]QQA41422.1 sugar-binding transcriptional regulator [Pelagovum pacificum]TNY31775.1 sugar-binding transcriptional regulator [Pelagovum pacificum]
MAKAPADDDAELGLAIRAAWLHFTGGMTQAQVASRLGLSNAKAHRLIAAATQRGAVRVVVEGPIVECIELETRLAETFGLAEAHVAPDLAEDGLPLKALAGIGAQFIERALHAGDEALIGFGHGRSLSAAVSALPVREVKGLRVVALMGGLTRNYVATAHDVMHSLAEKTGAEAYVMPVPFFANTAQDREVLLAQRGVRDVFELGRQAGLMIVGIGTTQPDAQLVAARMIEPSEIEEVRAAGAEGEMLGHFFGADGQVIETALSARTLTPTVESLTGRRIVAVAGGPGKIRAIRSVLKGGLLSGLITDEGTARALLDDNVA